MIFVSAVYTLYDTDEYTQRLLGWFRVLASVVPVHVVCQPSLEDTLRCIPGVVPIPCPFEELETYTAMKSCSRLPVARNILKDTFEFMILMNAKTECIRRVRDAGYTSDRYVWIDAGIAKILSDPPALLRSMVDRCSSLPLDRIVIPGCWETPCQGVYDHVCWRFCGGLVVVPAKHVDLFADSVLKECASLAPLAVWEVNVWASIEQGLPILWTRGDHNDHLFDLKTDVNESTV